MFQRYFLAPLTALLLLAAPRLAHAQTGAVGIGTTTPAASAALDVSSTTKGLLPPRLSQAQRDAIASPAAGLTIYNTTSNKLNTWNGISWEEAVTGPDLTGFAVATTTFGYTGSPQTYTVPAGVSRVRVTARGAQGGASFGDAVAAGGSGAQVQATLAVTPGQVMTVYVGGAGSPPTTGQSGGGYNGGGQGDNDGYGNASGGGGGASDVRSSASSPAYTDRLLVAAGGGGAGGDGGRVAAVGGAGGAPNGAAGAGQYGSGTGATQTSGAALGQGSTGPSTYLGGGGGGGYYGGQAARYYGGGGGGSSWVTPTGSSAASMTAGANAGPGSVSISTAPEGSVAAPLLDGSNFVNLPPQPGDNLGNHTATQPLNLGANLLVGNGGSGLTINSSGSVGLGTTTPSQRLDVEGSTRISGRLGIGTTTNANPIEKLEIKDGNIQLTTTGPAAVGISNASGSLNLGLTTNSGEYSNLALPGDAVLRTNGKRLILAGRDGGSVLLSTGAAGAEAERLRVTTAGNVGIGTAAPTQKLEVAGQVFSSTGGFRFPDNTVQTSAAPVNVILNQTTLQSGASFNISGNGYVGGNVGIGTTAPLSRLSIGQVTSQGNTAGQNLGELSFVGFNRALPSASIQALTRDFDDTGHLLFKTSPGGTGAVERLRIAADGNVGIGTSTPAASALLDVSSTTRGFLPPRLTTTQRDAIASPATGLVVYNTDSGQLNTWNGTNWTEAIGATEAGTLASQTFGLTRTEQQYTVPAGVTRVQVDVRGAQGGAGYQQGGGRGGQVLAVLAVTPGEVLRVYVGGAGDNAPPTQNNNGYRVIAGGYNGGGETANYGGAGAGGGASDIRQGGAATSNRVAVAGGGGGTYYIYPGGGGGGLGGFTGGSAYLYIPGTGGTQTGPGTSASGSPAPSGANGGGSADTYGGGGGGGYYGGGAGGQGGSGGGGSGFADPAATSSVTMNSNVQSGSGVVTITPLRANLLAPTLSGANITGTWSVSGPDVYRATGRVGIGTSTPSATLDVQGSTSTVKLGGLAGTGTRVVTTDATGTLGTATTASLSDDLGSHTATQNLNLSTYKLVGNGGSAGLAISSTGSVGIGTTGTLNQPLVVQASLASNSPLLGFSTSTGADKYNFSLQGGGLNLSESGVAGYRLFVQDGGNVGIGTSSPAAGLHIDRPESSTTTTLGVLLGGGSSGNPSIELRGSAKSPYIDFVENTNLDYSTRLISQAGTLNVNYGGAAASKPAYIFNVSGGIQATTVNNTSDQRLKQNIRPLTSALSAVLALRGVRYEWNTLGVKRGGTAGAEQVGIIAQEVEKVFPELVSTGPDGYKAVNYAQLTPVLIEALKEQQQQIEALKARATTAEAKAATAEADHASLLTLQAQMARLLGEQPTATLPTPARK